MQKVIHDCMQRLTFRRHYRVLTLQPLAGFHVCLSTTPLANCAKVVPFSRSTTSPKFGCVNTANVFLATRIVLFASTFGPFTKCGTALNFPLVISSSVSPVWKARQSAGMFTLVVRPMRERIYRPASGSGEDCNVESGGSGEEGV